MKIVRWCSVLVVAVVFAVLMVRDWRADPPDPTRTGSAWRGHNHQKNLDLAIGAMVVELVVVYAILRPWSYRRSWARSLAAAVALAPLGLFAVFITIHAGGVLRLHLLWVMTLLAMMIVATLVSGVAAVIARRRA